MGIRYVDCVRVVKENSCAAGLFSIGTSVFAERDFFFVLRFFFLRYCCNLRLAVQTMEGYNGGVERRG